MDNQIQSLIEKLRAYAKERDWEQFHSPKNLSMALSVEAGELVEIFQWMKEQDSYTLDTKTHEHAGEELADIFVYTLMISDKLGIDLIKATQDKMRKNADKYPAEQVRGRSQKYSDYQPEATLALSFVMGPVIYSYSQHTKMLNSAFATSNSGEAMIKPVKTKKQIRDELNEQIEAYLRNGGEVDNIAQGVSGNENNMNLFKQATSFSPKQDRTPVTEVVKELEARKSGKNDKPTSKKPKKVLITDDFGEPLRWVWKE